ncbi:Uncharacterized protein HZ326_14743 [Fusarium oxysporum f. sp. albedinis]|nr:Uncharacterized protein HZ326_14743 [Fusarium oxysporum f. sp. albedinis]
MRSDMFPSSETILASSPLVDWGGVEGESWRVSSCSKSREIYVKRTEASSCDRCWSLLCIGDSRRLTNRDVLLAQTYSLVSAEESVRIRGGDGNSVTAQVGTGNLSHDLMYPANSGNWPDKIR